LATLLFFVAAFLAVLGAFGIIAFRNPIGSVLSLVLTMLALSAEFLLLNAQFLFAVQIIVYAGAVMVLFLFVIALLGPVREAGLGRLRFQASLGVVVAVAFAILLVSLLGGGIRYSPPTQGVNADVLGTVENIAGGLFTTFLYPFELTSLLLLVAAIGAIYLSRSERE
jgi:NADH-quinone oxidoreductase subunit J